MVNSVSHCLVTCLLLRSVGNPAPDVPDDTARLSIDRRCGSHCPLVRPQLLPLFPMLMSYSRFTSNRLLLSPPSHSTPADTSVEWAYAFDVHTNAFFPLYLALYIAQLFLLPIILRDNWVCLWLGNTLYLVA